MPSHPALHRRVPLLLFTAGFLSLSTTFGAAADLSSVVGIPVDLMLPAALLTVHGWHPQPKQHAAVNDPVSPGIAASSAA